MLYMNDYDIHCARQRATHPVSRRAVQLLAAWVDIVNANSDGWAHWRGGARSAKGLMEFIQANETDARKLARVMGPIHRACTKHNLPRPVAP